MPSPSSESRISISSIALSVQGDSRKIVNHVVLETRPGGSQWDIPCHLCHGQEHKKVFDTPLELSAQDELSASLQYRTWWPARRLLDTTMKQNEIIRDSQVDADGRRTYTKFYRNINILVSIDFSHDLVAAEPAPVNEPSTDVDKHPQGPSSRTNSGDPQGLAAEATRANESRPAYDDVSPITGEILRVCPRFRLLIIGNTGVGKSSLIRNVFGVKDASVSESARGQAVIDDEHIAAGNGLFVIHDSLGLEAAEGDNLAKVKKFIRERRKMKDLKDRLHAVWVCLQVPYAKGRLLEAGMEEFLQKRKEILGDIPIVVVLTKLDLLDNQMLLAMRKEGVKFATIAEAKPILEPRRAVFLEEHCTKLLARTAEREIPHIAVSTKKGYSLESTISELVKKTTSEIERYIKADRSYDAVPERARIERSAPLYVAGMAQRASVEEKVNLTIAIGKKRYWTNLGASLSFSPERVEKHLCVIHQDIIQVWNFDDPERALQDKKFTEALLNRSKLEQAYAEPMKPVVAELGSLISKRPTGVSALPVDGPINLATFCYEIYRVALSQAVPKRFMEYVTDLTYVMKILFVLAPHGHITAQDVAFALSVYTETSYRRRIQLEINDFSVAAVVLPGGRDVVVEKIEAMIRRYNITDEEVIGLRNQVTASQNASAGS